MSDELREKVARAIYDVLEGPVNNADFGRQTRQWELSLTLADAALALIWNEAMEEAATVVERWAEMTFPAPEEEAQSIAAAIRARKKP